jgi:hypothetical protein
MTRDEMPQEIQSLIAQCEANVKRFSNDQMSAALHFAETLWSNIPSLAAELVRQRHLSHIPAFSGDWKQTEVESLIRERLFPDQSPFPSASKSEVPHA